MFGDVDLFALASRASSASANTAPLANRLMSCILVSEQRSAPP